MNNKYGYRSDQSDQATQYYAQQNASAPRGSPAEPYCIDRAEHARDECRKYRHGNHIPDKRGAVSFEWV